MTMLATLKSRIGSIPILDYIYSRALLKHLDFAIPTEPFFASSAASEAFKCLLANANFYVEYGSGGSTYLAAKLGKKFESYEVSPDFASLVQKKIQSSLEPSCYKSVVKVIYCGPTRSWGVPFPWIINRFLYAKEMKSYSDPHWLNSGGNPDLILIDGRFRVACALKGVLALSEKDGWCMVVDDYADRKEYHVISQFVSLDKLVGTTAFFTGPVVLDGLIAAIAAYELDYR